MKIFKLPIVLLIATACSHSPKENESATTATTPETTAASAASAPDRPAPSISSSPSSSVRFRTADINVQDSKSQSIGSIQLHETKNAILFLFETKKLPSGTYQIRLEENCTEKLNRRALAQAENLIKEIKIQGSYYSDEFKLTGYHFDGTDSIRLKNKAFKFYQIGKKSELKQVACGLFI